MLKEPPIWIFFCVLRSPIPRRTTFKFEYLWEFEPEFKNFLGYELGAHMGSIHEKKTRGQKSRATVPLSIHFVVHVAFLLYPPWHYYPSWPSTVCQGYYLTSKLFTCLFYLTFPFRLNSLSRSFPWHHPFNGKTTLKFSIINHFYWT